MAILSCSLPRLSSWTHGRFALGWSERGMTQLCTAERGIVESAAGDAGGETYAQKFPYLGVPRGCKV